MKLLVLLLVILAAVWLWQRGRRPPPASQPPRAGPAPALPMVRCQRCGVHVPGNEVVSGHAGAPYCSAAHRRESEGG